MGVWEELRPAIPDRRNFERLRRLGFGLLATQGRHTITAMMEATGRTERDWSADYRVFSRGAWEGPDVFRTLVPSIVGLQPREQQVIIASLDDTHLRKTGTKIPGVFRVRDPMSPPFHTNLIRAQRFVQASIVVPFETGAAACRAIPVAFDHAPPAKKPPANASDEQKATYQQQRPQQTLCSYGIKLMRRLRTDLDQVGAPTTLLFAGDGGYTNRKILRRLPERTHFIGRIRKDAVLHVLPGLREGRGRPNLYGERAPTPEALRQDESVPWQTVHVFAAGRDHECSVKDVGPLLWRKTGTALPLRLIVIRPLAYGRGKSGHLLYRQPAYLITTALNLPLELLVQAYFWRWEIEVNHRDEKQLIGVGQAQVRSQRSAERVPAFAVACYAMLLIAAARAFGLNATHPITKLPKWLSSRAQHQARIPAPQLLAGLRREFMTSAINLEQPNFSHFARRIERHMKLPKGVLSTAQAIHFARN